MKQSLLKIVLDYIDNFSQGSKISKSEIDRLFKLYSLDNEEQEIVYKKLNVMCIELIEDQLNTGEQALVLKENTIDEAVDYIYDHFKYGSEVTHHEISSLCDKFGLTSEDRKVIYQELAALKIKVKYEESPIEMLVSQLYNFIRKEKVITQERLILWNIEHNISDETAEILKNKIQDMGYKITKNTDLNNLDFIEKNEENLDKLTTSTEFQKSLKDYQDAVNFKYNLDYFDKLAQENLTDSEYQNIMTSIVLANKKLVYKIVSQYRNFSNSSYDEEDMFQAGMIGLLQAIKKFDVTKGYQFSTYATWWIRQKISREIAEYSTPIRLPVHLREKIRDYIKIKNNYFNETGEIPTISELASYLNISKKSVKYMESMLKISNLTSLDSAIDQDGDSTLSEFIQDTSCLSVEEEVVEDIFSQELKRFVKKYLSEREYSVLFLRFGIEDGQDHTLKEIGKIYGLTRERIRQIEAKALNRLREMADREGLEAHLYKK